MRSRDRVIFLLANTPEKQQECRNLSDKCYCIMKNTNQKPRDFQECLFILDSILEPAEKEAIKQMPESEVAYKLHFNVGHWIRNSWIYDDASPFKHFITKYDFMDIDAVSGLIITIYHRHVHRKELLIEEEIKKINWMDS